MADGYWKRPEEETARLVTRPSCVEPCGSTGQAGGLVTNRPCSTWVVSALLGAGELGITAAPADWPITSPVPATAKSATVAWLSAVARGVIVAPSSALDCPETARTENGAALGHAARVSAAVDEAGAELVRASGELHPGKSWQPCSADTPDAMPDLSLASTQVRRGVRVEHRRRGLDLARYHGTRRTAGFPGILA